MSQKRLETHTTSSEVEHFYDKFAKRVLLRDFYRLNVRQQAVIRLCKRFIPQNARVLEIGCGLGIITSAISKKASYVLAVDISRENVRLARLYVDEPHVQFEVMDVLQDELPSSKVELFDVIVLADVIEHIPKDHRPVVFNRLESLLMANGIVILTFPTPEYQLYLTENDPEKLQIVDEVITLNDILSETSLTPYFFTRCNLWRNVNQYIHLVLSKDITFQPNKLQISKLQIVKYRVQNWLWRLKTRVFRRNIK